MPLHKQISIPPVKLFAVQFHGYAVALTLM